VRIPRLWLLILAAIAIAGPLVAQDVTAPKPERGNITGTVTDDVDDEPVPGATVALQGAVLKESRTVVADDNGFFEFNDVDPGTYNVTISAEGFANWTQPPSFSRQAST